MDLELENAQLRLQENRPLRLANGRGVTIRCLDGIAWLTVEGEAGDCFLAPGQTHRLESDGVALVEGMRGTATIRLEAAGSPTGHPSSKMKSPHWVRRLAT